MKVIITGATGMVGEGVLNECLGNANVEKILVINRKPCGISHPKLKEILHDNFFDLGNIRDQLSGYDSCLFCLGVSSVGMKEDQFTKYTYTLTMHVAETFVKSNANMTFCYISGAGTDSTEKGRIMWAKVKGKTENDLLKLPFKAVYLFRPGYLNPTKGMKHTLPYYKYVSWAYPILRSLLPKYVSTLQELALAMINVSLKGYSKKVLEVKDIVAMSK